MKSEWEELRDIFYPIAQKLCWTIEDTDQLIYKYRYPEWEKINAIILMIAMEQERINNLEKMCNEITNLCKKLKDEGKIKSWEELTEEEKKEWLDD
jgi:F0F1-type ATP synthase delta subunit